MNSKVNKFARLWDKYENHKTKPLYLNNIKEIKYSEFRNKIKSTTNIYGKGNAAEIIVCCKINQLKI